MPRKTRNRKITSCTKVSAMPDFLKGHYYESKTGLPKAIYVIKHTGTGILTVNIL
jgi:hypothetical protein